nr:MAG TPA: Large Terminase [Caudoviricetes sp.]
MTLKQELIRYSKKCMKDKTHICQKHRWACMRFLRDVEKAGTNKFPYVFDQERAERFFAWAAMHKHTKGILAGQPIVFEPIRRFIFGNIYGWVNKDTGLRRFKKAYWQVGRKNAKSQSLAIVGDYEMMAMGEPMSEVYIGATKSIQSKIIYNEILAMLRRWPEMKGKWKESYGTIRHLKSDSIIRALSKDDGKTGDGLNPQCGLIDEYHAHPTSEILDVIDTGMMARKQPLLFIITTAGTNFGGPCYRVEYPLVEKILNPDIDYDVPDYFCMVNELDKDKEGNLIDDVKDEKCWIKANPIVATYPEGIANIRSALKVAVETPEKMSSFLTKNMNIWNQQSGASYMDMGKWNTRGRIESYDLYGLDAYVGMDLSSKVDLTSIGLVIPVKEDGGTKYIVIGHSFIPEETLQRKIKTDRVPYDYYARGGWLTVNPGEVVDYRYMTKWMIETAEELGLNIKEICYDPYNATYYAQELEKLEYTCVEVRQGMMTLSEPTKSFRENAYQGNILHFENPLLDWAISNAVTKKDQNENIMLDKEKSTNRIDPIASVINAFTRARITEEDDMSDYILSDDFSL